MELVGGEDVNTEVEEAGTAANCGSVRNLAYLWACDIHQNMQDTNIVRNVRKWQLGQPANCYMCCKILCSDTNRNDIVLISEGE